VIVGPELEPERFGLHHGDRQRAGLPVTGGALVVMCAPETRGRAAGARLAELRPSGGPGAIRGALTKVRVSICLP
jgi:hypothetical protein